VAKVSKEIEFSTRYNRHNEQGIEFVEPSLTQQQFKDECDVNKIMERYQQTGQWTDNFKMPKRQPLAGDFSEFPDLMEASNFMLEVQEAFMEIPAIIRKRFDNDPYQFLEFMENPENIEEARQLGLAPMPEEPEEPIIEPIISQPVVQDKPSQEV